MSINSEQIQALKAKAVDRIIAEVKAKHGHYDAYAPVMTWGEFCTIATERDADKALIAEQAERIAELECVCAESYQVVGALADSLGVFNDTKTIKALDNLSAQMLVHTDVLPFSVESSTLTVKLPESSIGEAGDFISHAEVVSLRDLRNLCDRAGITLVVGE